MTKLEVPFFRPDVRAQEVEEVVEVLRSGWLTTGPRVRRFEQLFSESVGASHAIAVNSCTAALHLAVEALELKTGQAVLVPTMTFAASAEVVRYMGGFPLLVDCDPATTNMDLDHAEQQLAGLHSRSLSRAFPEGLEVVGIMPVHVGGMMMNVERVRGLASRHGLWVVEDAAHAFPSSWRRGPDEPWQRCGESTADITCFSFYANKTITTGEGGMAVTADSKLAERIRLMSLHGLSNDAWQRYSGGGSWDYRVVAPGFKYNMTDIAAALGIHQLRRAEEMRRMRETIARRYIGLLSQVDQLELPPDDSNRVHSWHLFPVRLRLERLSIDRNTVIQKLKELGIGCSVHWRPLHLHPYYQQVFGWQPDDFPVATAVWERLISLPIFPGLTEDEVERVAGALKRICTEHAQ